MSPATLTNQSSVHEPFSAGGFGGGSSVRFSSKLVLPTIGLDEREYTRLVKDADRASDTHAHESWKVGMYVTLAMNPSLPWDEKLRYFKHALNRHCNPPPYPDEQTWLFYRELANIVKQHAGAEALRLASKEDDFYAARLSIGQTREKIESEAEEFFGQLIGDFSRCPDWLTDEDYGTIKMIRDQWI
jgi:hypothetical protein